MVQTMDELKVMVGGKILVTGCAGFIGARTCEILLSFGVNVVGLDNMNDYYSPEIKAFRLKFLKENKNFQFIEGDIEDQLIVEKTFAEHQFKAVINLAARAGVRASIIDPYIYLSTNTKGTLNILESMRKHGVNKIVLASTSSLYAGQEMPFNESLAVNTPISPYACSKKAAELLCYNYHFHYGIDVSIVRYFTVYGPAGRPDMGYFRFISWIDRNEPIRLFGSGNQSRDFTYIDDIAIGTIKALKALGYEIINLGGGKSPISINRSIEIIEKLLKKNAIISREDFNKSDMDSTWADISKAKELLSWEPIIEIEKGLSNCVDWYLDNKNWLDKLKFDNN
jgi:nucleoside-diphosphate-sugar epimerase